MEPQVRSTLIKMAQEAMNYCYIPYSNFPVGCALLCEDGSIFTGCNVENAAYSSCICAERTAFVKAISSGQRKFRAVVVTSKLPEGFCSPCGECRQFMVEFGTDLLVILARDESNYQEYRLSDIMPQSFGPEQLNQYRVKVAESKHTKQQN